MKLSRITRWSSGARSSKKGLAEDDNFLIIQNKNDNDNNENKAKYRKEICREPAELPTKDNHDVSEISSTPKKFFPPREVTVEHLCVPPSPISTNSVNERLLEVPSRLHFTPFIGDKTNRQLLDCKRLVRVILEPSHDDEQLLDTNTIMHAIRSHAMMKQELVELRKKQEEIDGDPPCILQNLGSPATATQDSSFSMPPPEKFRVSRIDNNSVIETATSTINRLEKQLACASNTILNLQEKIKQIYDRKKKKKKSRSSKRNNHNRNHDLIESSLVDAEESTIKDNEPEYNVSQDKFAEINTPEQKRQLSHLREEISIRDVCAVDESCYNYVDTDSKENKENFSQSNEITNNHSSQTSKSTVTDRKTYSSTVTG